LINEFHDKTHESLLPVTDGRLRPDRRFLEHNDTGQAALLKGKIEEKQRKDRKIRAEKKEEWKPRFFHLVSTYGEPEWEYNGNYWETREEKEKLLKEQPTLSSCPLSEGVIDLACDFRSYSTK